MAGYDRWLRERKGCKVPGDKTQELVKLLIGDAELRRAFRQDPKAVVKRLGMSPDDLDWEAVTSFDWDGSNEQLRRRVSKTDGNCAHGCNLG
jgi:hypothetical protein